MLLYQKGRELEIWLCYLAALGLVQVVLTCSPLLSLNVKQKEGLLKLNECKCNHFMMGAWNIVNARHTFVLFTIISSSFSILWEKYCLSKLNCLWSSQHQYCQFWLRLGISLLWTHFAVESQFRVCQWELIWDREIDKGQA